MNTPDFLRIFGRAVLGLTETGFGNFVQRRRILTFLAVSSLASAWTPAQGRQRIVLASLVMKSESFGARWLELIYTDAFSRLGFDLEIRYYPPARASAEAAAGKVDGELVRSFDYVPPNANLRRVEEPAVFATVGAYAKRPGIVLKAGWTNLRNSPFRISYRYGYTLIQGRLAGAKAESQSATTHDVQTGIRKLLVDRADIYVDYIEHVSFALSSEEFKNSGIYLVAVLEHIPFHAYLNQRHAQLLPGLSKVLKKMRRNGDIEHYRRQALAEYHLKI